MGSAIPWGLIGAAILLLALEVGSRAFHPTGTVPYHSDAQREYLTIDPEIAAFGAQRVSVVGSSRAREALWLPDLRAKLGSDVASYALAGARASEVNQIVRKLLAASPPPSLVIYGITPRQLLDKRSPLRNSSYLWGVREWAELRESRGARIDRYLPQVIRNEIGRRVHLMRYREDVRHAALAPVSASHIGPIIAALTHRDSPDSPLRGGLSNLQRQPPRHIDVSDERVQRYVDEALTRGAWKTRVQEEQFEDTLARLEERGVSSVVVELPISAILRRHLPAGVYERFLDVSRAACARHGIRFLSLDDLGVQVPDAGFLEQSHLNAIGSRAYTEALADALLARGIEPFSKASANAEAGSQP